MNTGLSQSMFLLHVASFLGKEGASCVCAGPEIDAKENLLM